MDFSSRNKVKAEWGMASMTDLVFLLLIFFIIMSLMSNNQTPIDLPKADENTPKDQNNVEAAVIVTENNKYVVMPDGDLNHPISFEEMKQQASNAVKNSGELKIKIAGHKNADYEAVFAVLTLAQANSWDPVLAYDK